MSFFDKIFGKKKDIMVPVSNFIKDRLPQDAVICAQSEIPAYCEIGNLNYEKKYNEAIELGKSLLTKTPDSEGVHVCLMDAYFKSRSENSKYFDLSTFHAKQAMICGHNTGYVQKRLVINLEKSKFYYQAVQLCDIILSDKFNFSSHGGGKNDNYESRKKKIISNISNSLDAQSDNLFSDSELKILYRNIIENNENEAQEIINYEQAKKNYENWFSEEESNKRVNSLRNALYGNSDD